MALAAPPAFVGQITVTTGINDKLYWREDNGTPYDLSVTVNAGTYWPDTLGGLLGTLMETESTSNGYGAIYSWTFSTETGKYTVAADSGQFYLKTTTSESDNVLTGGDSDTRNGAALDPLQWGQNAIGWFITPSYSSLATSAVSPIPTQHFWAPSNPPQQDDDGLEFDQTVVQSVSIAGAVKTYDWSGWDDDKDEFVVAGNYARTRDVSFEFVTTAEKEAWIGQFWGPYGKAGSTFRYYPDRTAAAYLSYVLTGRSLTNHGFSQRIKGYQWWRGSIEMQRVSS